MKNLIKLVFIISFSWILTSCDQLSAPEFNQNRKQAVEDVHKKHAVQVKVLDLKKNKSKLSITENSVGRLIRFPAEEKRWLEMKSNTAYTRDVLAGVETYITNATDGETWNVEFVVPDSNRTTIPGYEITFYKNYSGQENCFVSNSFVLCGSDNLYLQWYVDVQCEHSGEWEIHLINNDETYATKSFYLKPQIPPGKVPSGAKFNQGTYSTIPYDSICIGPGGESVPCDSTYTEPYTIQDKGCYLTAGANILAYHGVNVDVVELNSWLSNNGGYTSHGNIFPHKIAEYARRVKGIDISYLGSFSTMDDETLHKYICKYGPQMIGTKLTSSNTPTHFVTATGKNVDETTFLINDPDGGITTTLTKYGNRWNGIRAFSGPEYTVTNNSNLTIHFHSPGELVLTNPSGERVGYNPITGTHYSEISGATYGEQGLVNDSQPTTDLDNDPSLFHALEVMKPMNGDYTLKVIGTGTGTYALDILTVGSDFDDAIQTFEDISIIPGATHTYKFSYSQQSGSQTSFYGGYDGGGQRPRDVNKFLSYSNPSERSTTLPSGTTTFSLHVFYGNETIPSSFTAELNRSDISNQFNPVPGTHEIVNLSLSPGKNVILLSMDGKLTKRTANDKDRLVIEVE